MPSTMVDTWYLSILLGKELVTGVCPFFADFSHALLVTRKVICLVKCEVYENISLQIDKSAYNIFVAKIYLWENLRPVDHKSCIGNKMRTERWLRIFSGFVMISCLVSSLQNYSYTVYTNLLWLRYKASTMRRVQV